MANYIATANLNEPNLPRSGLLEQSFEVTRCRALQANRWPSKTSVSMRNDI
ncbi:MAG: hypothetical protein ACREXS_02165 [Gammaproteobacteria bacterium]